MLKESGSIRVINSSVTEDATNVCIVDRVGQRRGVSSFSFVWGRGFGDGFLWFALLRPFYWHCFYSKSTVEGRERESTTQPTPTPEYKI